jgi:MFS family permease
MVVLLQFWITRRARGLPPLVVVAIGTVFYAIGFGMYGFGGGIVYFSLAMAVLTIGEMIVAPSGQALAARFAPADMRGRYMALFGFSWALPFAFGPLAAGYIMDNFNPNWVWWGCAILGALVVGGYLALHARAGSRLGLMGDESEEPAAAPEPSAEAAA